MSGVGLSPALATCETSQVLLAGVSGGFSWGSPVFAPPTNWPISYDKLNKQNNKQYEPQHEKTNILHMRKQRHTKQANQHLCFHYTDSTFPLFSKSKSPAFRHLLHLKQLGLYQSCSQTTLFVFSPRSSYMLKLILLMGKIHKKICQISATKHERCYPIHLCSLLSLCHFCLYKNCPENFPIIYLIVQILQLS